jgi:hypothetical protein
VCVNGPALVLCGRDMWFFGKHNMCDRFCVLTIMYVNPKHVEQKYRGIKNTYISMYI